MANIITKFLRNADKTITKLREQKKEMEDKSFCGIRKDDMPIFIRPMRIRNPRLCALSGRTLVYGEYAYPALGDPIKLWPYGRDRVGVQEAMMNLDTVLPADLIVMPIPTYESIVARTAGASLTRKQLQEAATRLLKEGMLK